MIINNENDLKTLLFRLGRIAVNSPESLPAIICLRIFRIIPEISNILNLNGSALYIKLRELIELTSFPNNSDVLIMETFNNLLSSFVKGAKTDKECEDLKELKKRDVYKSNHDKAIYGDTGFNDYNKGNTIENIKSDMSTILNKS